MPNRLYLDTARLGLMSGSAQRVYIDFVRFAGEEAGSLYCEQFLQDGTRDWPESLQGRFPALQSWQGLAHLKRTLKQLAGATPDSEILLANRSAVMMQLAAKLLFNRDGRRLNRIPGRIPTCAKCQFTSGRRTRADASPPFGRAGLPAFRYRHV